MASVEPTIGDDESFLVYADELIRAGDPRGELIHLDHAIAKQRTRELVDAREQLFTRFPALAVTGHHLEWRLGFVDTLGFKFPYRQRRPNSGAPDGDELGTLPELLAHPSLRFLRRLILDNENITQAHFDRTGPILPATLAMLDLGAPWGGFGGRGRYDLTRLLASTTVTSLAVSFTIGLTRSLPTLRAFTTSMPDPPSLGAIVAAAPALEQVMLFGANQRTDLAGLATLPLGEFTATYVPIDHVELDRLAQIKTLRKLRLWNAGMTPALMQATRERFAHLEHVDIRDALASRAP